MTPDRVSVTFGPMNSTLDLANWTLDPLNVTFNTCTCNGTENQNNNMLASSTLSSSNDSGLNQIPIKPRPLELWLELSFFIVIDILGLIGNVLVIAIVTVNTRMRLSANLFILSLSAADLLVSVLVTPMLIVSRYNREWQLGQSMCQLQAFVNHTCLFASIFNLAAIAVNRAVAAKMPHQYKVIFSNQLSTLYIGVTWFISCFYAALPFMGWGLYTFDFKRLNCIFSRKAAPSFSIFFSSCCVVLPLTICAVAYALVLITYVKSRQNLRRFGSLSVSGPVMSEMQLTKSLFIVWLSFFLCWLPMNVLFLIDPRGNFDSRIYTFAVWLMLCNSCVNPFIYGSRRKFRKEYFLLVKQLRCTTGPNRVHPSNTGTNTVTNAGTNTWTNAGTNAGTNTGTNIVYPVPSQSAVSRNGRSQQQSSNAGTSRTSGMFASGCTRNPGVDSVA